MREPGPGTGSKTQFIIVSGGLGKYNPAKDRNAMTTASMSSLLERRAAIVREHIAAEKAHDISRIIATFDRPRYELAPFCSVSDGEQAVRDLLTGLFATFPDFDIEHP